MNRPDLRRGIAAATGALLVVTLGACSTGTGTDSASEGSTGTSELVDGPSVSSGEGTLDDTHAQADDGAYDPTGATTITLADGASSVDGTAAAVDGDVVTISQAGTYLLSGSLSDGQVIIDSTGEGKVVVVLDGVDITSATTSPLVVTAADEAVVILADGSTNSLADSAASSADDEDEDAPTATVFSMADLTIAGTGSLEVTGASNDAVTSKDGLVILSGTLTVQAVDDGIRGKDYVVIEAGDITVDASGDGLKADNDTAGELGWIQIDGGSLTVSGQSDAADAVGAIYVTGGEVTVPGSGEGLEAAVITISGGGVDITASDDGINATSGSVSGGGEDAEDGVLLTVSGGTVLVSAGSDGIDSNGSADISGGTIVISTPGGGGGGGNGTFDVNGTFTAPAIVTLATDSTSAGQTLAVATVDGTVVATFVLSHETSSVVVSATGLVSGTAYAVYAGDAAGATVDSTDGLTEIGSVTAADATSAATGGGGGRGGGPGGGGFGGGPGGTPPVQRG